jgi:hypothetical protein
MNSRCTRILAFAGAALAAALVACDSGSTNPGNSSGASLSQAEATSIGQGIALDADGMADGVTLSGLSASAGAFWAGPPFIPGLPFRGLLGCVPTVTPTPIVNSDTDFVPDSVHIDFTGCAISNPGFSLAISGSIDVIDPTPTVHDRSRKKVFNDFIVSRTFARSGDSTQTVENGVELMTADASSIQFSQPDVRTIHVVASGDSTVRERVWAATFTADVPGSIQHDEPLPSGVLDVAGSMSWVRGSNSRSFAVSTNPDLHFDASCTVSPRFDSGTITAVVTKGGATQTITIAFTACGQFTVTKT